MGALQHETPSSKPVKKKVKPVLKTKKKVVDKQVNEVSKLIDFSSDETQKKAKTKLVKKGKKKPLKKISSAYKTQTNELVDKILHFCMLLTGITLFPYQQAFGKRIIKSMLNNDSAEITALFSRQSGKSETVSVVISGLMVILPTLANTPAFYYDKRFEKYREGVWIGLFAPSERQTKFVFNRVRSYLDGSTKKKDNMSTQILTELGVQFSTNNGENVVISTDVWSSRVTCITASDNAKIEGESLHLILCDETQDISDFILNKSILPMGSFYNASTVFIGTASTKKCEFYFAIERNKKKYKKSKGRIRNHFEYDWRTVAKYNPNYLKTIQKEREKGEHRDEFRMSYNLEWILNREMFLTDAVLRDKVWNEELTFVPSDLENTHVVGIDLGKAQDDTVVTVVEPDWKNPVVHHVSNTKDGEFNAQYTVYKFKVKDVLYIEGDDWEAQYHIIYDYLQRFKISRIVIDSTGVGSPIYDRLRVALPHIEVVPYSFNPASKSDLYKHFITELGAGRIDYPYHPDIQNDYRIQSFHQQATSMEKFYRGSYLVCQHPDRRGAKDDFVDSLALAAWGVKSAQQVVKTDVISKQQLLRPTPRQQIRHRKTSRRRHSPLNAPNRLLGRVLTPVSQYVHSYNLIAR
jgi:hypothetical protein